MIDKKLALLIVLVLPITVVTLMLLSGVLTFQMDTTIMTIPADTPENTPLLELSTDEGKTWQTLAKDGTIRLQAKVFLLRQTTFGRNFEINISRGLEPVAFIGSIRFDPTTNFVRIEGKGTIMIGLDTTIRPHSYAKIILESE